MGTKIFYGEIKKYSQIILKYAPYIQLVLLRFCFTFVTTFCFCDKFHFVTSFAFVTKCQCAFLLLVTNPF